MSELLIKLGKKEFEKSRKSEKPEIGEETFSGDPVANALLADFDNTPHAFVLGCLMDLKIPAEKAWALPRKIFEALGSSSIEDLKEYSLQEWVSLFKERKWHPLGGEKMGKVAHHAVRDINEKYCGDASRIWHDKSGKLGPPSSIGVVLRFREFHGAGQKISTMAANILVRDFHVKMSEYRAIDISVDVHIERVMKRMGVVPEYAENEMIIWKAREMNPEYPGVFDYACWKIGRDFCHSKTPDCKRCPVRSDCQKIGVN